MNLPKISVIVPVFNTEKYLNKCLDSLVTQSYEYLEFIIINDGSTDSSFAIIQEYAAKDNRILVINKENGGIGSAYRVAFTKVTGEYISFVDSDDFVEPKMYEELVTLILKDNPDYIHFGIRNINVRGEIVNKNKTIEAIVEGSENILKIHFEQLRHPSLVRLFRKGLFENIKLLDQNIGIDEIITIQVLPLCHTAVYTNKVFYYIFEREDSISRTNFSEKTIRDCLAVYRLMCNSIENTNPKFVNYIYDKYINILLSFNLMLFEEIKRSDSSLLKEVNTDLEKVYRKMKKSTIFKAYNFRKKLTILLLTKFPSLSEKIYLNAHTFKQFVKVSFF